MRGSKEIWSKALALALLQVATAQKRSCQVVHFNTEVVQVDDWLPGKTAPLELLDSLEPFYGGGTDLEPPLSAALDSISVSGALKKADVILVTDGQAEFEEGFVTRWNASKAKHEFSCYAVHVDAPGSVAPAGLGQIADHVIGLSDVAQDSAAVDVVLDI